MAFATRNFKYFLHYYYIVLNDPFNQLNDRKIDETSFRSRRILLIGRTHLGIRFRNIVTDKYGYNLYCTPRIDEAINYMMQFTFPVILLDFEDMEIDVITLSKSLRKTHETVRIILVTPTIKMADIESTINSGNIDAIIPLSLFERDLVKLIQEQDAKYAINRAMVSFVSNPPTLSRASFLLLDPSLSFETEMQPLNFVGILINCKTVSRFTHFFEETIVQDELLLGSYLASINALGEELFKSKKSVKEINFGGISVIFRFYKTLQFSFLIRNLNRHNCEKAEYRINNLLDLIIPNFGLDLMESYLSEEKENNLLFLVEDFNQIDEVDRYLYHEGMQQRINQLRVNQILVTYTNNEVVNKTITQTLNDFNPKDWKYKTIAPISDEELYDNLQNYNNGLLILDSKLENLFAVSRYAKDIAPTINIVILNDNDLLSSSLTKGFNQDLFDYIFTYQNNQNLNELVRVSLRGLKNSRKMIEKALMKQKSEEKIENPIIAKTRLLLDNESYYEEELPKLVGIVIIQSNKPIFEKFWFIEDGMEALDKNLLTGLITSLKKVGGEVFINSETIGSLEMGDVEIFVKHQDEFIYLYILKNIFPNTSVLINKELEAVTLIFNEIISGVGLEGPVNLVKPMLDKIADTTNKDLTKLFRNQTE